MKRIIPRTRADVLRMVKNAVLVVLGTFVLAFGTSVFIIPFDLVTGGVSGIGIIFHRIFREVPFLGTLTTEIYASVINLGLFVIGLIFLGRTFALKTLVSTVVYPVALQLSSLLVKSGALGGFFDLLSEKYAAYGQVVIVLAAVFGGALVGAGCALTFLGGGSTGGTDVIALILAKYIKRLKSSTAIFAVDALVVVLGMFAINDMVISLLGVVSALICAIVIDRMFIGESQAFIANVVSDRHEEMVKGIIEKLERTATVTDATGAYSGQQKKMIMVSFSLRQYADFIALVSSVDRRAFVTIHRAHEINGEGWTYDQPSDVENNTVAETVEKLDTGVVKTDERPEDM